MTRTDPQPAADVTPPPGVLRLPPLQGLVPPIGSPAAVAQERDGAGARAGLADQPTVAAAEAEPWATVFGDPALGPDVFAVAVSGRRVYVGGDFFYAFSAMANETYNRIAMWDGAGWQPLGTGLNGAVHAIAVVGDDVYVGGDFTVAGGVLAQRLARWDGTAWSAVSGGITGADWSFGTTVRALVSDGRTLYVGGTFSRAGDVEVRSLAALDLTTGDWTGVGGGVSTTWSTDPADVRALVLSGTTLYVGGSFERAGDTEATSFAALDTGTGGWTSFGGVTDDGYAGHVAVLALDEASGTVYIGGRFTHVGELRAWNVARLTEGSFGSLGDASYYGGKYANVMALAVAGGKLYSGGIFTAIGAAAASSWAVHDGTDWGVPGDGVDNIVRVLVPYGEGGVVVMGDFTASGSFRLIHGGVWTGAGWETFGQGVNATREGGGEVHAIVPVGDGAFVGGLFDQAGHHRVGSIARWTGTAWDTMAGGVGAAISHGRVFAMAEIDDVLYVAGSFTTAGGVAVNNIARWDGRTWSPLGEGLSDSAHALTVLGGRLYVGGRFHLAGRLPVGRLACWDPATEQWSAVGNAPVYDHDVLALETIYDRYLVAGGYFHRFFHRGVTVVEGLWGIALFDTHAELNDDPRAGYLLLEGVSRWGAPGWVHALQVIGDDLYVGGWFNVAGILTLGEQPSAGFPVGHLAVWHFGRPGGGWEPCGDASDHVDALTSVDGDVVAAGKFVSVGPTAARHVARLDRDVGTWHPFGSGLGGGIRETGDAHALAQGPATGLWVGGWFASAGGRPSANVALWTGTRGQEP